jgi:catechol 2,3-dioxygenase-like lactoylglutathione lyase family enzyme
MASTGLDLATQPQELGTVAMRLEVITIPVSDLDRAKSFYQGLGWRIDADAHLAGNRVVQLTPPQSPCSIHMGEGLTSAPPGSAQRMVLAVEDIAAARDELMARGVEASEPFHLGGSGIEPGPDPDGGSYNSYISFSDPDGNSWLLQEVTQRLPGRLWED